MKENKNRLVGAIHILQKQNKCVFILFLTIFACIGNLDAQTPQIWPTEISFNYEDGSSDDAITIKKNASTSISVPEYVKDLRSESCAYIIGQTNRKIKVKFNSNNSNMNYLVKATVISGAGIGNVCEIFVAPCDLNTTVFTIDLSGSVPNSIGKRTFTWKWEATALPLNSPYCPILCTSVNTEHTYYSLLDEPKAPMTEPWTEVLDLAFTWVSEYASEEEAINMITEMLYYSGFEYGSSPRYGAGSFFNLTQFLSEYGNPYKVNCTDMGKAVTTFANSVGSNLFLTRFNAENFQFPINCIDPIGVSSKPTNHPDSGEIFNDCRHGGFNFHVFSQNINKQVWDASLRYDIDEYPDNVNPLDVTCGCAYGCVTTGHIWESPLGIPESEYLGKLLDNWVYWAGENLDCEDPYKCVEIIPSLEITIN